MEVNLNKQEINNLRDVLRIEIRNVKREIREVEDNRIAKYLYGCIENYEDLEKKLASYIKNN